MAAKNPITVGDQFGWLFPIERLPDGPRSTQIWKCVCHCGSVVSVRGYALKSGNTRSCGCYSRAAKPHKRKPRVFEKTRVCVSCKTEKPIEKFYLRGDSGLRRHDCAECNVSRASGWVGKNKSRVKKYKQNWNYTKRDEILPARRKYWAENAARLNASAAEKKKEYREKNREACNARIKDWKRRNKGSLSFYSRSRQARLRNAIPPWADLDKIEQFYIEADRVSRETGVKHHVDHIVPLIGRGGRVCGLHCEQNLRVITAEENLRKNGYYWPDMP